MRAKRIYSSVCDTSAFCMPAFNCIRRLWSAGGCSSPVGLVDNEFMLKGLSLK